VRPRSAGLFGLTAPLGASMPRRVKYLTEGARVADFAFSRLQV
jgi:hypothetical protein